MTVPIIWVLLLVFLPVVPWGHGRPGEAPYESQPRQSGNEATNDRSSYFDIELLEVMIRNHEDRNVVVSPLSVKLLLGMLMEGSAGASKAEIRRALRLPVNTTIAQKVIHEWVSSYQEPPTNIKLNLATHMFVADGYNINPDFAAILSTNYGGNVSTLDVKDSNAAADKVNTWVTTATENLIPALVSPDHITSDTSALLASAVYFKGSWLHSFEGTTTTRCFYKTDGNCTEAVFMQKTDNVPYAYISAIDAHAVELPYKNDRFSMIILKPGGRVQELSRDLPYEQLHRVLKALKPTDLQIQLPRFTAEFEQDLVPTLRSLRISEVFGPLADLTRILEKGNDSLTISNIFHAAKVIVNEEGSEAAGVTGALIVPLMRPVKGPETFIADKPFIFFIRDSQTNVVLFEGRISAPEEPLSLPTREEDKNIPPGEEANLVASVADNSSAEKEPSLPPRKPGPPPPIPDIVGRPNGFLAMKVDAQLSSSINFEDTSRETKGTTPETPKKRTTAITKDSLEPSQFFAGSSDSFAESSSSEEVISHPKPVSTTNHRKPSSKTTMPPPLLWKPSKTAPSSADKLPSSAESSSSEEVISLPKPVSTANHRKPSSKTTMPPPLLWKPTSKIPKAPPSTDKHPLSPEENWTLPPTKATGPKSDSVRTGWSYNHAIAWHWFYSPERGVFAEDDERSKKRRSPTVERIIFRP